MDKPEYLKRITFLNEILEMLNDIKKRLTKQKEWLEDGNKPRHDPSKIKCLNLKEVNEEITVVDKSIISIVRSLKPLLEKESKMNKKNINKYHTINAKQRKDSTLIFTCDLCQESNLVWEREIGRTTLKVCLMCNLKMDYRDLIIRNKDKNELGKKNLTIKHHKVKFINAKDIDSESIDKNKSSSAKIKILTLKSMVNSSEIIKYIQAYRKISNSLTSKNERIVNDALGAMFKYIKTADKLIIELKKKRKEEK